MNYARIYSEFIADRLTKQPVKPDYFEKHHILPRSLGGGNEKSNLIRLTPEDHLFAHLLLAKIHGGKMWNAAHAMVYLANDSTSYRRKFGNRPVFGEMRREVASYHSRMFSGPCGPQSDKKVYELHNFDGRVETGNRFYLEEKTGVSRQQISAVLRGAKKNAHGWYCKKHNPFGKTRGDLLSEAIRDHELHTLYHHDGRVWVGLKLDFRKEFGVQLTFQTHRGDCSGWHRTKQDADKRQERVMATAQKAADARGSIAGANNPNSDKTEYKFKIIETGEVVRATKWDARELFGVTSSGLCALFNGRQKKTGGIALA